MPLNLFPTEKKRKKIPPSHPISMGSVLYLLEMKIRNCLVLIIRGTAAEARRNLQFRAQLDFCYICKSSLGGKTGGDQRRRDPAWKWNCGTFFLSLALAPINIKPKSTFLGISGSFIKKRNNISEELYYIRNVNCRCNMFWEKTKSVEPAGFNWHEIRDPYVK